MKGLAGAEVLTLLYRGVLSSCRSEGSRVGVVLLRLHKAAAAIVVVVVIVVIAPAAIVVVVIVVVRPAATIVVVIVIVVVAAIAAIVVVVIVCRSGAASACPCRAYAIPPQLHDGSCLVTQEKVLCRLSAAPLNL